MRNLIVHFSLLDSLKLVRSVLVSYGVVMLIDLLADASPDLVHTLGGHVFSIFLVFISEDGAALKLQVKVPQQRIYRAIRLVDIHQRANFVARFGDVLEVVYGAEPENRVDVKQELTVAF